MSPSFNRTEAPHHNRRDSRNLKAMLPYLWAYRGRVGVVLFILLLAKVANVGIPVALKEIVDALDSSKVQTVALPIVLLLTYGLLRLSSSMFNELRDAVFAKARYGVMRQLSNHMLNHLHQLSLRFHLERKTGAITRDLERGTRSVSSLLNYLIFNIIPTAVEFLLVGLILFTQYDGHFALITFSTVLVYIAFTFGMSNWRMHHRHDMNNLESKANNQAIESLVNYETVKYFGNEAFEARRYNQTLERWEEAAIQSQVSMSALNFGQGVIIATGVTILMTFAAQGVVDGKMSLGDLVLVNAYLLQLFIPLGFLGMVYRAVKYSLADMDLMFKTLEQQPEVVDAPNAKDLNVGAGDIRFTKVDFSYQTERKILHQVDFFIPAGHKLAIVGASGAGKSTLARLLYRFYDVSSGQILINGQDISQVTQRSLRMAIGIVPQDTVLFNDSIYYNILYAQPQASREEVEHAARLAHIHDFIESLPQGYDTLVGERGLKLSGGEKQRVAIARAILKNPRILIFDEATSSLDSTSEQFIQTALQEVAEHHTTLVIAHRLSTIVDADQILVMEGGSIIERGTHAQLLQQQGVYAQMWALQQEQQDNQGAAADENSQQAVSPDEDSK